MARRVPEGPPPPPVVQRIRLRYAKRGRLRFTSHRDFARAFERALRRGGLPMGYSAGFTPHPKISYLGAAPTGVASEAEYLEIGLSRRMDVEQVRRLIDEALPDGLDIVDAVESAGGSFAEQLQASRWEVDLPGVTVADGQAAVEAFLASTEAPVERLTKDGRRTIDARPAVLAASVRGAFDGPDRKNRAILELVVRQETPAVRPDDVLAALRSIAGLALSVPPLAVRLEQGPLDGSGVIGDPLAADRAPRQTDS